MVEGISLAGAKAEAMASARMLVSTLGIDILVVLAVILLARLV